MTVQEFLKEENGVFDDAKLICDDWKGYKVYSPFVKDSSCPVVGLPHSILEKNNSFRWTDDKECFEVLDFVYPDDE